MATPKEIFLAHASAQIYDPQERRERYLRERQLKGRNAASGNDKGNAEITTGGRPPTPRAPKAPSAPSAPSSSAAPITPQRVKEMQVRLAQLKELLAKLTEEAKKKAGVDTKETKPNEKKAEDPKDKKEPEKKTTAEKKEAAKKAKEDRKKDPKTSDTVQSLQTQLNAVHDQIADMRAKLAAAKQAASTKTVPKAPKPKDDKKPGTAIVTPNSKKGE